MYKKLWFGTIAILIVALLAFALAPIATATPSEFTYRIQVTQNGEPLPDAYVRIAGVGVEMTDSDGIVVFDISDAIGRGAGRQQLFRGPKYALNKGKLAGSVTDEFDILDVTVCSHDIGETPAPGDSAFSYGTKVYMKLNVLYQIKL